MLFQLRRPNVLPLGDLGVRKGLVRCVYVYNAPGLHPNLHAQHFLQTMLHDATSLIAPPPPPHGSTVQG